MANRIGTKHNRSANSNGTHLFYLRNFVSSNMKSLSLYNDDGATNS